MPWCRCPCISALHSSTPRASLQQMAEEQHCCIRAQDDTSVPWQWFFFFKPLISLCVQSTVVRGWRYYFLSLQLKYLVLRFYGFGRFNAFLKTLCLYHIALVFYAGYMIKNKTLDVSTTDTSRVAKGSSWFPSPHSLPFSVQKMMPSKRTITGNDQNHGRSMSTAVLSIKLTLCRWSRLGVEMDVALCSPYSKRRRRPR